MYVLNPLLNESYVKYGNGLTVQIPPIIIRANAAYLNITFGLVENLPGSGPNDTVEIFVKFSTANDPLVLSGRPLQLTAILNFDAGSSSTTKKFIIVGPLLKPLLAINKTVKVRIFNCLSFVLITSIRLARGETHLVYGNRETRRVSRLEAVSSFSLAGIVGQVNTRISAKVASREETRREVRCSLAFPFHYTKET